MRLNRRINIAMEPMSQPRRVSKRRKSDSAGDAPSAPHPKSDALMARYEARVNPGVNQLEECRFCDKRSLIDEPRDGFMCAKFAFAKGVEWRYVVQTDLSVL